MKEKNIADYLHLYLGCNVRFKNQELKGKINQENLWKLFSVTKMDYGLMGNLFAMGCIQSLRSEEIYPILRPLSDMSEEERVTGNVWSCNPQKYRDHPYGFYSPLEFKYLLSKHFDLFGLIEAGLAIDKTKSPVKLFNMKEHSEETISDDFFYKEESCIQAAVEIVDLMIDMIQAGANTGYMNKRIAAIIFKHKFGDVDALRKQYSDWCNLKSTAGFRYGAFSANVFEWLQWAQAGKSIHDKNKLSI